MKAIIFDRDINKSLLLPPEVTLLADSAITPPGRPVFLPDFDSEWMAEFYLAIKVSRLGKEISPKFASRYFEQAAIAVRLVPITISTDLRLAVRPSGIVSAFDNALTLGPWTEIASLPAPSEATVNGNSIVLPDISASASEAICSISRYCTLKTGDIVMPFRIAPTCAAVRGATLSARLSPDSAVEIKLH